MNKSQNSTHNHKMKQYLFCVLDVLRNAKSHCDVCTLCFTAVKSEGDAGLLRRLLSSLSLGKAYFAYILSSFALFRRSKKL